MLNQDGLLDIATAQNRSRGGMYSGLNSSFRYDEGGLYARVIDKPAMDCVGKGITISGDEDKEICDDFDRLKLIQVLQDAARYIDLSGGAVIVPIIAGRAYKSFIMPFNPNTQYKIDSLRVYPISDFSPSGDVYTDANNPKFNMPIFYNWNNVTIHESRMIAIKGMPFSSMNVQANPFQGRVTAAKKMEAVNAYYDAVGLTLKVLERKQQAVYTMQGLADALLTDKQNQTTDGEQTVRARINLVDNVRSLLNSVVIDGGDGTKESTGDEFVINDLSLSGIKDAVAIQESRVSADTGIPVTVLFGQSANGLNATGESDWKNYYSTLTAIQSMLSPAIERIVAMLAGQIDIKGLADNWKIEFNPLPDTDEKADAEVAKLKADANKVEADSIATIYNLGFTDDAQIIEYMKSKNLFGYAEEVSKSEAASYANETS